MNFLIVYSYIGFALFIMLFALTKDSCRPLNISIPSLLGWSTIWPALLLGIAVRWREIDE